MAVPSHLACYLVEWYRPELAPEAVDRATAELNDTAALMATEGVPVHLIMMLAAPSDDVVFGIFTAESPDIVAQACRRAGIPARRLTDAVVDATRWIDDSP